MVVVSHVGTLSNIPVRIKGRTSFREHFACCVHVRLVRVLTLLFDLLDCIIGPVLLCIRSCLESKHGEDRGREDDSLQVSAVATVGKTRTAVT